MTGAWRPSEDQTLLLHVALAEPERAMSAWRKWRVRGNPERLDPASARLLPQVYRKLVSLGLDDSLLPRLRGVHRHTWSANAVLLAASGPAVEALKGAGIESAVVGSAAAWRHYGDSGARAIESLDLLVRPADVSLVAKVLESVGWSALRPMPRDPRLMPECSAPFAADTRRLSIHWRTSPMCHRPGAVDEALARSGPATLGEVRARVLDPTDELLSCAIHAVQARAPFSGPLLSDALTLIRSAGSRLDWNYLLNSALRDRLVRPLIWSLRWLEQALQAPVPGWVRAALENTQLPLKERVELGLGAVPISLAGRLPHLALHYLRLRQDVPDSVAAGFGTYLQVVWGLRQPWEIPFYMLRRGVNRVRLWGGRRASADHSSASGPRIAY